MVRNAITVLVAMVVAVGALALLRRWRTHRRAANRELAQRQFQAKKSDLTPLFLTAASSTGKPRGLRWEGCDLIGGDVFAVDRVNGDVVALAGATIRFSAIVGGPMEDVEAVGNLRSATAVFIFRGGEWTTDGRVIFNLQPEEALRRFEQTLVPLAGKN